MTTLVAHDVDTGTVVPIKQHPYRLSPWKREVVQQELEYMLAIGAIEPGVSEWSSPVVLVAKEGGTHRLCIDYRKVNAVTSDPWLMNLVTAGLPNVVAYINDVVVYSNDWRDHMQTIGELFQCLADAGLVVNPLTFLAKFQSSYAHVFRLSLILQPYGLVVKHIAGKDNVVCPGVLPEA